MFLLFPKKHTIDMTPVINPPFGETVLDLIVDFVDPFVSFEPAQKAATFARCDSAIGKLCHSNGHFFRELWKEHREKGSPKGASLELSSKNSGMRSPYSKCFFCFAIFSTGFGFVELG